MRRFIICAVRQDTRMNLWRFGLRWHVAGMVGNEKYFLDFVGRQENSKLISSRREVSKV